MLMRAVGPVGAMGPMSAREAVMAVGAMGPGTRPKRGCGSHSPVPQHSLCSAHVGFPASGLKALKHGLSGNPGSSAFPPQK